jgi:hypothetical protein
MPSWNKNDIRAYDANRRNEDAQSLEKAKKKKDTDLSECLKKERKLDELQGTMKKHSDDLICFGNRFMEDLSKPSLCIFLGKLKVVHSLRNKMCKLSVAIPIGRHSNPDLEAKTRSRHVARTENIWELVELIDQSVGSWTPSNQCKVVRKMHQMYCEFRWFDVSSLDF